MTIDSNNGQVIYRQYVALCTVELQSSIPNRGTDRRKYRLIKLVTPILQEHAKPFMTVSVLYSVL